MDFEQKKTRLLLVLTDPFDFDVDIRSISSLPYLGRLSMNGLWARVRGSQEIFVGDNFGGLFSIVYSKESESIPVWQLLEREGVPNRIHQIHPDQSLANLITQQELKVSLSDENWSFFGVIDSRILPGKKEMHPILNLDEIRRLDQAIERLALAAGEGTALWVVSLPASKDSEGWFLAGGNNITPGGNLEPITLADIVLTIPWWFGIEGASKNEGRILDDIQGETSKMSQEEMDLLTDHLRGLGYLG